MLTTPITTPHFHSNVLSLLSRYLSAHGGEVSADDIPVPTIPALNPADTPLTPDHHVSQLIAVTSPWIDLASPDPVIANLSRQVLHLEIAYAAFCGASTVMIRGPVLHHGNLKQTGITHYARAILESLNTGPYLQLQLLMPMVDDIENSTDEQMGYLGVFARAEYLAGVNDSQNPDEFGSWDAWNTIRSVCRYNSRLTVGKNTRLSSNGLIISYDLENLVLIAYFH